MKIFRKLVALKLNAQYLIKYQTGKEVQKYVDYFNKITTGHRDPHPEHTKITPGFIPTTRVCTQQPPPPLLHPCRYKK